MTGLSTAFSREIETLEAELRLALNDASLPLGKRAELEERLSAIKAKAETASARCDDTRAASSSKQD